MFYALDLNLDERQRYCLTYIVAAIKEEHGEILIGKDTVIRGGATFDAVAKDAQSFGFLKKTEGSSGYIIQKECMDILHQITDNKYESCQQSAYIGA